MFKESELGDGRGASGAVGVGMWMALDAVAFLGIVFIAAHYED